MPDPRKGEQIILVTNNKNAIHKQVIEHFKARGMADISIPRKLIIETKMPVLGSGKVDYQAVKFLLEGNLPEDAPDEEADAEL